MTDNGQPEPGRAPSAEESFLLDWIKEAGKGSYAVVADVLKQLVTINSAFVGTLLLFADKSILDRRAANVLVFALIFAAIVAFVGLVPDRKRIPFNDLDAINRVRERQMGWKYWCMLISATVMLASLLLATAFSVLL